MKVTSICNLQMYYFIPLLCSVLFLDSFPLDMVLHFHVSSLRYDIFSTAETLTWINEPSAGDGVTGELMCNFKLDLYWKHTEFCEKSLAPGKEKFPSCSSVQLPQDPVKLLRYMYILLLWSVKPVAMCHSCVSRLRQWTHCLSFSMSVA